MQFGNALLNIALIYNELSKVHSQKLGKRGNGVYNIFISLRNKILILLPRVPHSFNFAESSDRVLLFRSLTSGADGFGS